jgi:SNF2 family DNA or RNA helicase
MWGTLEATRHDPYPRKTEEPPVVKCIVSKKNQVILAPRTGQVVNMFPDAHVMTHLDQDYLVVPHGLRETLMLRHLGYKVQNPMLAYYDWKGGKPFDVQRHTCDLMTTATRAYILNSMGTGKTKATLWAWDYLHGKGLAGKLLVVATLSTLKFVWQAEVFATLPHRRVEVLHGTKAHRLERLREDADIYVINHDGLKTIQAELAARTDIDVLCLDELAVYRNNSDRSKAMRKFAERFKIVWGLTGRPMPNEPTDVWAQAKIVTPHTAPRFFRQAQELLMLKVNNFKWVPRAEAIERAMTMLQPNVRFSLDDVIELPDVVYRTIDVPLSSKQDKVYKTLAREFKAEVANQQITAVNAAVAMGKLLQVSGGWVYAKPVGSIPLDAQPRHETLIDLINENERKVIVYVPFRHAIEGLSPILTAAGIDHAIVHGDVSGRGEIFNAFQHSDKYKVLLAHPQCVAHGLTLTRADTIVWYMPITSLEIYEQANARITRIGQKHKQRVLHMQSTPVEKKIYALLQRKQRVQDTLLEMLADATEKKL